MHQSREKPITKRSDNYHGKTEPIRNWNRETIMAGQLIKPSSPMAGDFDCRAVFAKFC
jgi:hypothetical protein